MNKTVAIVIVSVLIAILWMVMHYYNQPIPLAAL